MNTHYQDNYKQQYKTQITQQNNTLDITTTTHQPHTWGQPPQTTIKKGIQYIKGITTIKRQLIQLTPTGYTIIAQGQHQHITNIQLNHPCQPGPTDPFKHHLNQITNHQTQLTTPHNSWNNTNWTHPTTPQTTPPLTWINTW